MSEEVKTYDTSSGKKWTCPNCQKVNKLPKQKEGTSYLQPAVTVGCEDCGASFRAKLSTLRDRIALAAVRQELGVGNIVSAAEALYRQVRSLRSSGSAAVSLDRAASAIAEAIDELRSAANSVE